MKRTVTQIIFLASLVLLPTSLMADGYEPVSAKATEPPREMSREAPREVVISRAPAMQLSLDQLYEDILATKRRAGWGMVIGTGIGLTGLYALAHGHWMETDPGIKGTWTVWGVAFTAVGGITTLVSLINMINHHSCLVRYRQAMADSNLTLDVHTEGAGLSFALHW